MQSLSSEGLGRTASLRENCLLREARSPSTLSTEQAGVAGASLGVPFLPQLSLSAIKRELATWFPEEAYTHDVCEGSPGNPLRSFETSVQLSFSSTEQLCAANRDEERLNDQSSFAVADGHCSRDSADLFLYDAFNKEDQVVPRLRHDGIFNGSTSTDRTESKVIFFSSG